MRTFFRINLPSDTSPIINWAAYKATIPGKLPQIAARIKQSWDSKTTQQEKDINNLLSEQRASPQIDRYKIDMARLALNLSLTTQAEKRIRWA